MTKEEKEIFEHLFEMKSYCFVDDYKKTVKDWYMAGAQAGIDYVKDQIRTLLENGEQRNNKQQPS